MSGFLRHLSRRVRRLYPLNLLDAVFLGLARLTKRNPANGILILFSGAIGDTVMFAVVLPRLLALARDGEPVTVLVRSDGAKVAFLFPSAVDVMVVEHHRLREPVYRWRTLRALHTVHYRAVVSADFQRHPELDEAMIAACRADETWGMVPAPSPKHAARLSANRRLFNGWFDSGPEAMSPVIRLNAFAGWLTGRVEPPPIVHCAPGSSLPKASLARPTVLVQPFSSTPLKQVPADIWRSVIGRLGPDYDVVILGAAGDLERSPAYAPLLELPNTRYDTSALSDLVPLMRAADLVVSVDTATMHVAAAVGARTLCLATAAHIGTIVPYEASIAPDDVTFIHADVACAGCLGEYPYDPEAGMYPCVAQIDDEEVVSTVARLLALEGVGDKEMDQG